MTDELAKVFSTRQRALVISAAGCGKTELIAKAISKQTNGKSLILTHTNAGVRSLRERLKKYAIPARLYSLDTIAGFALKYAVSFPETSNIKSVNPQNTNWNNVYIGAKDVIEKSFGKKIIDLTYDCLYVDEYQDCTIEQHDLIMKLAEILPCRIVGDPMQGIFDFGNNKLVSWEKDIFPNFERLPDLKIPWRWKNANQDLGNWLSEVRDCIEKGIPINIHQSPNGVYWYKLNFERQRMVCYEARNDKECTNCVAIQKWGNQAHSIARTLRGAFTSMEEIECRDLFKWANKIENNKKNERAKLLIEFASKCMTKVSTELKPILVKLENNDVDSMERLRKNRDIVANIKKVLQSGDFNDVLEIFSSIEKIKGTIIYRRELWTDMKKSIREYLIGEYPSLENAAWNIRNNRRYLSKKPSYRSVSRTLLIKGLEFDHSIILDADQLNSKELYVAMTRGSKLLTILSSSPILKKEIPKY